MREDHVQHQLGGVPGAPASADAVGGHGSAGALRGGIGGAGRADRADDVRCAAQSRGAQTIKDITWQIAESFDLAPSLINLAALETELRDQPGRQDRLVDALARVAGDYDYCIIDCPPNVGLLTFNAMRACEEAVIPVETGYFSLHGLSKQLELMDQLRKQCRQEIRVRVLATLYDIRTKLRGRCWRSCGSSLGSC